MARTGSKAIHMKILLELLLALGTAMLAWPAGAALNVFACEPEWGALAQELGGDKVAVFSATTALQDPHRVEARPSLIARIRNADLVVCSGSELEIGWLPLLLTQSGNNRIQPGTRMFISIRAISPKSRRCSRVGWSSSTTPTPPSTRRVRILSRSAGSLPSRAGHSAPFRSRAFRSLCTIRTCRISSIGRECGK